MSIEQRAKRRKSSIWARVSLAAGLVLVVLSGAAFTTAKVAVAKADAAIPDHDLGSGPDGTAGKNVSIKGAKNILLASLDTRPSWSKTGKASHTDSIILLHIPADHSRAYMLSIPRDFLVQIPAFNNGKYKYAGGMNKINAAFAFGSMQLDGDDAITHGTTLLANTIQQRFGIKPDAAAIINYDGFKDILGVLKKVCLYVDQNVTSIHIGHTKDGKQAVPYTTTAAGTNPRPVPGVTPNRYKIGNQCLNPTQALDFARQRDLLEPHNQGDYDRQRHQQQLIKAIMKTAVSQGLQSPTKLPTLLNSIGKAMTVFLGGISLEDWALGMKDINPDKIVTIKTNGGKYDPIPGDQAPPGVGESEGLYPDSITMFENAKSDTLDNFVLAHPTWISKT
ncbi:LCP family protein [Actinoplanes sp. NPDC051411]|uniref:LCP family protein n=1 Tax=Actinoplanes sp. NPDC051411 TaxID=3155522 RepID=UPI00342C92DC